jgi:hypothetical protein
MTMPPPPAMSLAVVGAAFKNADGSDRHAEIRACEPGERVFLIPEPDNPHDGNAVAVFTGREVQIGYISAERARLVSVWMADDNDIVALFQRATDFGAWIRVAFDGGDPELTEAMLAPNDDEPASRGSVNEPDFYPDEVWPDD